MDKTNKLKLEEMGIYYRLVEKCNDNFWNKFVLNTRIIAAEFNIKEATCKKYINALIEKGYIKLDNNNKVTLREPLEILRNTVGALTDPLREPNGILMNNNITDNQ